MPASAQLLRNSARTRRFQLSVAVLALVLATLLVPAAHAAGTRIMPLGDSITHGYNVPGGYRSDLEDLLVSGGYPKDFVGSRSNGPTSLEDRQHEGHGGWRIDGISAGVDPWLAAHQPEVVLLLIGTNDMIQNYSVSTAPQRLSALIDQIAAGAPTATVVVSSLPRLGTEERDGRVRTYNAAIPGIVSDKVAEGKRVVFIDMYPELASADFADGIHPNATGYSKMASVWSSALRNVLPPPGPPPVTRTIQEPAKLQVARARVLRRHRELDLLAPITRRADGQVDIIFRAAGQSLVFRGDVDSANGRVRLRRSISAAQARLGTGIVTISYPGNDRTRAQRVRLRAASRKAELRTSRPSLVGDRVVASGTVPRRARGVVRVQLDFVTEGRQRVIALRAPIRNGRWRLDARLAASDVAAIEASEGSLHSYILYTGYLPQRVRGEMRSLQVAG